MPQSVSSPQPRNPSTLELVLVVALAAVALFWRLDAIYLWQDEAATAVMGRSEERRVGKECRRLCRSRWSPYH
jgi:hypothetical protein